MGLGSLITFYNGSLRNAYGDIWHSSARRYIVGVRQLQLCLAEVTISSEQPCVRRRSDQEAT